MTKYKFTLTVDVNTLAEWYDESPNKAIIEFTPTLLKRIRQLQKAAIKLKVDSIILYDYTPEYRIWDEDEEKYQDKPFTSMECHYLHICDILIFWSAIIKHSDIKIETESIDIDELYENEKIIKMPSDKILLHISDKLKYVSSKTLLEKRIKNID